MGLQLCSEGILTQRQIIPINNDTDLSLSFQNIDVHLQLPEEVLDLNNCSLEIAFSPLGPGVSPQFILPDGMIPVSPAVWLCFSQQKKFDSPVTLKLPHCFDCANEEDTKSLWFLKAEHDDISRDSSGHIVRFKPVDRMLSKLPCSSRYGILNDHHFCIYCLAVFEAEKDLVGKINYCLSILKPTTYPKEEANMKIFCILHFDTDGCRQVYCIPLSIHPSL